jgi:hypothetical protein
MPSGKTLDERWPHSPRANNCSCVLAFLCALFRVFVSIIAVNHAPHVLVLCVEYRGIGNRQGINPSSQTSYFPWYHDKPR